MCLIQPPLRRLNRWNWDGDHIVHESIVPSSRRAIGRERGKGYDIDVREFLVTENNAVTRRVLRKELPAHFEALDRARGGPQTDLQALTRRERGDFDMRAHLIASYVAATIGYGKSAGRDPWQFPDETLSLKRGDCEDIAFVLASLLLASGISGYNVRVALGKVIHERHGLPRRRQTFDHMWVMYKCEAGRWLLLEPLRLDDHRPHLPSRAQARKAPLEPRETLEYRPYFLFNCDHLWTIETVDARQDFAAFVQRKWTRLHPAFAGRVHQTIVQEALQGVAPPFVRDALDRHFSRILGGPVVEDVDLATQTYDPRDHFDNGYIAEGWAQVQARLAAFGASNSDLDSFALAAHGIADFYAHSSYLHFARLSQDKAQTFDPSHPAAGLLATPGYGAGTSFDFGEGGFTLNGAVFKGDAAAAATAWEGQLISGRYAQKHDSRGVAELITSIPGKLIDAADFARRGGLPHHNEIAVDDGGYDRKHKLYEGVEAPAPSDRTAYANQFRWRRNTAVEHIRQAFIANWNG